MNKREKKCLPSRSVYSSERRRKIQVHVVNDSIFRRVSTKKRKIKQKNIRNDQEKHGVEEGK